MADKNIKLKTKSGDVLLPITLGSNVSYGAIDSGVSIEDQVASAWTKYNLKSGANVKIEKHINPNVITDDTVMLLHCDGNSYNAIGDGSSNILSGASYGQSAPSGFGTSATLNYGVLGYGGWGIDSEHDFTFDARLLISTGSSVSLLDGGNANNMGFYVVSDTELQLLGGNQSTILATVTGTGFTSWIHVAMERFNGTLRAYVNGNPIYTWEGTNTYAKGDIYGWGRCQSSARGDEFRFTSSALYRGLPYTVPTEAYTRDSTSGYYELNTTGLAKTSDLASKQDTLVSGTNIKTINNTSLLGSGDITVDSLPAQTGQSGKFLTTDGSSASWATVQAGTTYTAGTGIDITSSTISVDNTVYTSDTLLSGNNISLSPISGGKYVTYPNYSSSLYVENVMTLESETIEISTSFIYKETDHGQVIFNTGRPYTSYGVLFNFMVNPGGIVYLSQQRYGTSSDVNSQSLVALEEGKRYWVKVTKSSDNKLKVVYSEDGTTYTDLISEFDGISQTTSASLNFYLGTANWVTEGGDTLAYWHDKLFLSDTKITVDGTVVFDGSTSTSYSTSGNPTIATLTAGHAVNATYSAFTGTDGSSAGTAGLVPAPAATDTGKFLKADGTWAEVQGGGVSVPTLTWYTADDWTLSQDGLTLTIADTSSANLVKVYRNGVLMQPTADYTISGTSLVVQTALTASEKITLEVF